MAAIKKPTKPKNVDTVDFKQFDEAVEQANKAIQSLYYDVNELRINTHYKHDILRQHLPVLYGMVIAALALAAIGVFA